MGFGIARGAIEEVVGKEKAKENACKELNFVCDTAFEHGFGKKYNEDEPLAVVIFAKDEAQLKELQEI